ncbi:hypothetical protein GQX74_001962 [Glossina fuscipes]|nr:hypothetical protein GQX74_001962 [Glossina fuscipes]
MNNNNDDNNETTDNSKVNELVYAAAVKVIDLTIYFFQSDDKAEGSNILLDPYLMCKKTRRLRGKMAEICRHDSALLKEIINGINLGFRECEFQFRNRRWNCTALRKSMRKILMRGIYHTIPYRTIHLHNLSKCLLKYLWSVK